MRRYLVMITAAVLAVILNAVASYAAVWQWSVPVRNAQENNGHSKAYLWIPPDCKQVKAVVFAQNNMEEQWILENPEFRKKMAELGFAEVWASPAFNLKFLFNGGAGECFEGIMNDLAAVSGYSELSVAPIAYMGHSASASAPYYFAAWNPGRTLACVSVSGQWPYVRNVFAPDIWKKDQNVNFIPCLETMGEYEAAATWSGEGLKERADHPQVPLSMLACPGEFHFASTESKALFIAFYLKKAAEYRLPKNTPVDEAPKLIPVDPTKTGWLVDRWRYNQTPAAEPAPANAYKGDVKEAFWYFDEETAKTVAAYEARHRDQKPELIGYTEHGKMVEQRNVHQQFNLKFIPETDGITFKVHTAFYDTVPGGSPRPSGWAHMPVGSKVGHSSKNIPISVDRITGPFIKLNDSTFQVHPQMGFWEFPHSYELWFSATHPGDKEYKPAVQQALMPLPIRNTKGKEQHIEFSAIADQHHDSKSITLTATSDANVPVGFYVLEGPAEIQGSKLNLTGIPLKAKFPVKVTVVAWQYGNSNEPQLQTADPVERTFYITK